MSTPSPPTSAMSEMHLRDSDSLGEENIPTLATEVTSVSPSPSVVSDATDNVPTTHEGETHDKAAPVCDTAETTEDTPTKQNIHKAYTTSAGIILETTDNVYFGFDLDLLSRHSSFFRYLADLPTSSPAEDGVDPAIPVPACAAVIKVVLDSVVAVENDLPLPSAKDLQEEHLHELVVIADMFELAQVVYRTHLSNRPFQFVLAAFSDDTDTIYRMSPCMLQYEAQFINEAWWAIALKQRSPKYYKALEDKFKLWAKSRSRFKLHMSQAFQTNDFGRICSGFNHDIPACTSYLLNANFSKFRNRAFDKLWTRLARRLTGQTYWFADEDSFVKKLDALEREADYIGVDCRRCLNRIITDAINLRPRLSSLSFPTEVSKWRIDLRNNPS